jgi:hypothetical protein
MHPEMIMATSLESILHEALCFEAGAFDDNQAIPGAELVEWFAEWRRRARTVVHSHRPTPTAEIYGQLIRSQLLGALRALQFLQERAEVEGPRMNRLPHGEHDPPTDAELDELVRALDNGGIHITCGQLKAMVFKRPAKESSCKRS